MFSMIEDASNRTILNLPSWVPDLSAPNHQASLLFPAYDITIPYAAGIEDSVSVEQSANIRWSGKSPDILHVKAYEVDQITLLSTVEDDASIIGIGSFKHWAELTERLPSIYTATDQSKETVLWRTLIGDCARAREYTYPAPKEYKRSFEATKEFVQMEHHSDLSEIYQPFPTDLERRVLFEDSDPSSKH
jgi:hypothetical protein